MSPEMSSWREGVVTYCVLDNVNIMPVYGACKCVVLVIMM